MGGSLSSTTYGFIFNPPSHPKSAYIVDNPRISLEYCLSEPVRQPSYNNKVYMYIIGEYMNPDVWLIYSHGNACDISDLRNYMLNLSERLKCGIVIYDYCGYGLSDGKPSEADCYANLQAVVTYLKDEHNIEEEQMVLVGQSLGTGVTVEYAKYSGWTNPIILISPYKSMVCVVAESADELLRSFDSFRTIDKISYLKCPVKYIHGGQDMLIPMRHSQVLWSKTKNQTLKPTWLSNAGHSDILGYIEDYVWLETIDLCRDMNRY